MEALKKIGLTKNQSTIYVSLLKLGEATAQQIMKESGMHRSRVYDSLENLNEQGLVSFVTKDFRKFFKAVKPDKLLQYIEEKKEAIKQILPDLRKLEGAKKEEIKGGVYKGKEGLKTIHNEMLKEGKDVRVLGAKAIIVDELQYFMPNFERERIKKKIKWISLWDNEAAKKKATYFRKLIEGRVLPKGYASNGVVNIFGNKVATVLWKENYPTAFMIENKEIADSYRKWFDLIWSISK